jgi:hypothetical protein
MRLLHLNLLVACGGSRVPLLGRCCDTRIARRSEVRPDSTDKMAESAKEEILRRAQEGVEAEKMRAEASCADTGKWISSFAAIVASFVGTLVRDASVLQHLRVPLAYVFFCLGLLVAFRFIPFPQ